MSKRDLLAERLANRKEKMNSGFRGNLLRSKMMSIPLTQMELNPNNDAAKNDTPQDIERLATRIAAVGLLHNLVVNQIDENRYMLISGEKRYRALSLLNWEEAPCVVYFNLPRFLFRYVTNLANDEQRDYTISEKLQRFQEMYTDLLEAKKKGYFEGPIGKELAKEFKISEQQVVKYRRLCDELSPEELAQVTNINEAYKQLIAKEKAAKKETEFNFSDNTAVADQTANNDPNDAKNETEFNFSDNTAVADQTVNDDPNDAKNETEFNFSGDTASADQTANDDSEIAKNETEFNFSVSESEPTQLTIDGKPEASAPTERPARQLKTHRITAQEVSIEHGGISYLCAFGTHVNGGWIAILNFGVSAELSASRYDVKHNARMIREALQLSEDDWLPTGEALAEAAQHIAEVVTEMIGGM